MKLNQLLETFDEEPEDDVGPDVMANYNHWHQKYLAASQVYYHTVKRMLNSDLRKNRDIIELSDQFDGRHVRGNLTKGFAPGKMFGPDVGMFCAVKSVPSAVQMLQNCATLKDKLDKIKAEFKKWEDAKAEIDAEEENDGEDAE